MQINYYFKILSATLFVLALLTSCYTSCKSNSTNKNEFFRLFDEGRIVTDGGQSRGVAWGDYDNDGDPDLYVANADGQWNFLYRNDGNGKFKKITDAKIKASETVIYGGNSQGVNWVDYDNDKDLDLFIVSRGKEANLLFRNEGLSVFTRITDNALTNQDISASMACWADMDNDGDLDVFLAGYSFPNLLFQNIGNGQFERIKSTVITEKNEGNARACACGDSNNDGLPELYIANARIPNTYFFNLGKWKFDKIESGHLVEDVGYSYGVSWADYDDDGYLDLFVANFDKQNFLYKNDRIGNLNPVMEGDLVLERGGASKGHSWGDYDNDGDLDLYIANGTYAPSMSNFLYLNQGNGSFMKQFGEDILKHADTSAGVAHADFDRDGDLDLFVANWGSRDQVNRLYENVSSSGNWISVRLMGRLSNSYGIGSKVEVFVSNKKSNKTLNRWMYTNTGYASQNDYELHFGLGAFQKIDSIKIHWTSGIKDTYKSVKVNNHWLAIEQQNLIITN